MVKDFNDFNILDFNGDELVDVFLAINSDSLLQFYVNNTFPNSNDIQFSKSFVLKTIANPDKLYVVDINNSNKNDLLYLDTNNLAIHLFLDSSFLKFSPGNTYNFKADSIYSIVFNNSFP